MDTNTTPTVAQDGLQQEKTTPNNVNAGVANRRYGTWVLVTKKQRPEGPKKQQQHPNRAQQTNKTKSSTNTTKNQFAALVEDVYMGRNKPKNTRNKGKAPVVDFSQSNANSVLPQGYRGAESVATKTGNGTSSATPQTASGLANRTSINERGGRQLGRGLTRGGGRGGRLPRAEQEPVNKWMNQFFSSGVFQFGSAPNPPGSQVMEIVDQIMLYSKEDTSTTAETSSADVLLPRTMSSEIYGGRGGWDELEQQIR
nr:hypothetical protein Iba_chr10fCG8840 [Ipomoea batatas]